MVFQQGQNNHVSVNCGASSSRIPTGLTCEGIAARGGDGVGTGGHARSCKQGNVAGLSVGS